MANLWDPKILISHSVSPEKRPQRYPPYGPAVAIPKEVPILGAKIQVLATCLIAGLVVVLSTVYKSCFSPRNLASFSIYYPHSAKSQLP